MKDITISGSAAKSPKAARAAGTFSCLPNSVLTDARFCLRTRVLMAVERAWDMAWKRGHLEPYALKELADDVGLTAKGWRQSLARTLKDIGDVVTVHHRFNRGERDHSFIVPAWVSADMLTQLGGCVSADANTGDSGFADTGVSAKAAGVSADSLTSLQKPANKQDSNNHQRVCLPAERARETRSTLSVRRGDTFTDVALKTAVSAHIRPERAREVFQAWNAYATRKSFEDWCAIEREQSRLTPEHPNFKGEKHVNGDHHTPRVGPAANAAARKQTNRGFVRAVQGGH